MNVVELGHVALGVASVERSARFYREILGLPEVARAVLGGRLVAFFSLGSRHHDLALIELDTPVGSEQQAPGLNHVGLKVGNSVAELRVMRDRLIDHGFIPIRYVDHHVCKSLHFKDPDGILIELYVDADPSIWAANPRAVANSTPCHIDDSEV